MSSPTNSTREARNENQKSPAVSGAVDSKSGSSLTLFELDNKNSLLGPGSYVQVTINLQNDINVGRLPVSAIMVRSQGVQVATVDKNNRIVIKSITVGNDFGSYIEVLSGLNKDDRVIDTPPDLVENGELVRINQPSGQSDKQSKAN